jgi:hypothetical protein
VHLLMLSTPRPLLFFGWIVALVTTLVVVFPFSTTAPLDAKIATAVVDLAIGVATGMLVGGAAARSTTRSRPPAQGFPPPYDDRPRYGQPEPYGQRQPYDERQPYDQPRPYDQPPHDQPRPYDQTRPYERPPYGQPRDPGRPGTGYP